MYDLSDELIRCDKQTRVWFISFENTDDQTSHFGILGHFLIPMEAIMPGCVPTSHSASMVLGSLGDV